MENEKIAKVSFFDAAIILSDLFNKIDNADEDISEALIEHFDNACKSLTESIDRRKYVYRTAEAKIEFIRSQKQEADEAIKKLKKIQERIMEMTKVTVGLNPDLPFQDSLGNKLTVRKNSQPNLVLALDLRESKAVTNILDQNSISLLGIDQKYIKPVTYFTLDTEQLKRDLQAGEKLTWATLHYGTHVRGLK